jgi:hypothetical protein
MKHRKDKRAEHASTAQRIDALKASSVFDDPYRIRVVRDAVPEQERISGMWSEAIIGKNADGILVRVRYGYGIHDSLLILDANVETSAEACEFYEAQFSSNTDSSNTDESSSHNS